MVIEHLPRVFYKYIRDFDVRWYDQRLLRLWKAESSHTILSGSSVRRYP